MRKNTKMSLPEAIRLIPAYFINVTERVPAEEMSMKERMQIIRLMKSNGITLDHMTRITGYNRKTLVKWVKKYWEGDVPYNRKVVKMYMNRMKVLIKNVQSQLNYLYIALDRPLNYREADLLMDKLKKGSLDLRRSILDIGLDELEDFHEKYLKDDEDKKLENEG